MVTPFLGKLSLDLRKRFKKVLVKTFLFVKLVLLLNPQHLWELLLNLQHVFPIFSNLKIKYPIACAQASFTNFPVVDAILPITAKHAGI